MALVACCRHIGALLAGQAFMFATVEKSFGVEVGAEDSCFARSCSSCRPRSAQALVGSAKMVELEGGMDVGKS